MPADCWSAGVIMFIMLSCVPFSPAVSCRAERKRNLRHYVMHYRGFHPFDQDPISSMSPTHFSDQNSQNFANSQNSIKSENKVKKRILNGNMCFPENIWNLMLDGASFSAWLSWTSLTLASLAVSERSGWSPTYSQSFTSGDSLFGVVQSMDHEGSERPGEGLSREGCFCLIVHLPFSFPLLSMLCLYAITVGPLFADLSLRPNFSCLTSTIIMIYRDNVITTADPGHN